MAKRTGPTLGERVIAVIDQLPEERRPRDAELARRLDYDRSTISQWRRGMGSPRYVEDVAEALGVTVAELYAGRLDRSARRRAS